MIKNHTREHGDKIAKPPRFESLQVFRGLAATAVVLFHTAYLARKQTGQPLLFTALTPGASGVDFFFVLSGFIICTSHAKDIGVPERLKAFLYRRFIRIYPLYLLLTLSLLLLYALGFGHYGAKLQPGVLIRSFLLFPQPPGARPVISAGWTLAHEALFYGGFAALLCAGRQTRRFICCAFLLLSLLNCLVILPGPYWIHTWLFSPYNLEFAAGCWASLIACRNLVWMLPAGVSYLSVSWYESSAHSLTLGDGNPTLMLLLFGIPYWLIITGAASLEFKKVLHPPGLLVRIGDATYSIYLGHFTPASALVILLCKAHVPPLATVIATSAAVVCIGYCLYRVVELPLLQRMKAWSPAPSQITLPSIPNASRSLSIPTIPK